MYTNTLNYEKYLHILHYLLHKSFNKFLNFLQSVFKPLLIYLIYNIKDLNYFLLLLNLNFTINFLINFPLFLNIY